MDSNFRCNRCGSIVYRVSTGANRHRASTERRGLQSNVPTWLWIVLAALVVGFIAVGRLHHAGSPGANNHRNTGGLASACQQWWADHHVDGLGIEPYEIESTFIDRCRT